MNRNAFIYVLFFVAAVTSLVAYPKQGEISSPNGAQYVWDGNYWRPLSGTASGSMTSSDLPYASCTTTVKQCGTSVSATVVPVITNYSYITLSATEPFKMSVGVDIPAGCDYQNVFSIPWNGVVPVYLQGVTGTVTVTLRHYGF